MATTPIYNWPTPDNTDLVKNGALAIRTLGDAVDTTMATMIPKSLIAAKGDLVAASANDTPAILTAGNNGETIVADSSTATGLKWAKSANFVGCSLYQTAGATAITNNTYVAMAYDAERFDTHGFHDNSTNNSRITIPAGLGGYYLVRTNTRFDLSSVGTRQGAIFVNGIQITDNPEYAPSAASYISAIGSVILNLNAGDYIQHCVRQTTAGALNIYARNEELPFQVQFLGA